MLACLENALSLQAALSVPKPRESNDKQSYSTPLKSLTVTPRVRLERRLVWVPTVSSRSRLRSGLTCQGDESVNSRHGRSSPLADREFRPNVCRDQTGADGARRRMICAARYIPFF